MIYLIILLISMIMGGYKAYQAPYGGIGDYFASCVLFCLYGLIIYLTISLILTVVCPTQYKMTDQQDIVALDGTNSTQGNFFLGTGSVDSEMKYYYLVEKDGGRKIESTSHDRLTIYNSDNPRIEEYYKVYKNDFLRKNFVVWDNPKYKIYIPEGTIKHDFEVPPFDKE